MSNVAASLDAAAPVASVDDADPHRNVPRPDPACLYGLIGEIARAGSASTEANPYAIGLNALAYLSCAVGRGPYMPVGNTWHHARLFTLHIGRSGEGRKGDAVSLLRRIAHRIRETDEALAPQIHAGGLSSREGLAFMIHDGFKDGKTEVPAIHDKRLWVVESEFANVLHQGKRDGNTLSTALRDCWDGQSLRPATKSNRCWASDPHVCLSAAITPNELRATIAARDLSNGFANRFLMVWAERSKVTPFPKATPDDEVTRLAERVREVLRYCDAGRWAQRDAVRVSLSSAAADCWAAVYMGELNDRSYGESINALLERRAPMLLRIAMLLALTDQSATIEPHHLDAALAWIRYATESVRFVFASAADEAATEETNATAEKIVAHLRAKGSATRTQLFAEVFSGHISKDALDEAIDALLAANPPRVLVEQKPATGGGKPTKIYRLPANLANLAKNQHWRGFAGDSDHAKLEKERETTGQPSPANSPVRNACEDQNRLESPASIGSSQIRQIRAHNPEHATPASPAKPTGEAAIDDGEVFR